ncbi:hypothetical protein ACWCXH_35400 [Kitasatospora sp. NPDC001660]
MLLTMAKGNVRMLTNRDSGYDPSSGDIWRVTVNLDSEIAAKLKPALKEIHPRLAAAGFISKVMEMLLEQRDAQAADPATMLSWAAVVDKVKKDVAEAVRVSQGLGTPQEAPQK